MSTIAEVESLAFELSVSERATLASRLLESLPEILSDDDEGVAEALRRREELLANPDIGITSEELRQRISERFPL
jgi:putative addiction module component (TIGR02574 family)